MPGDGTAPVNNLNPGDIPTPVVNRDKEHAAVIEALTRNGPSHLYLHGPRGTGKTLCIQHLLRELSETMNICYLSGITDDTQYKVFTRLAAVLADTEIGSGYHTAQLYNRVATYLQDHQTVIVLDDIEFLLMNDGNDLLYALSRLDQDTALSVVALSANYPDLAPRVDDRTYSSLQPRRIRFTPYTVDQAVQILTNRTRHRCGEPITAPALRSVAGTTTNIRLGLHWLAQATTAADDVITADQVPAARTEAVQRYRDALLADFSPHHHILLEAVEQLTAGTATTTSGAVYDRYETLCAAGRDQALTPRRVSDYLTHLELLGIIDVEYHRGGSHGKTREISLTSPLAQD